MKATKAFTLIELLIAMVITLIVTAGIFFIYYTAQRYLKAGSAFVAVSGGGRNSAERIIRAIRQANNINILYSGNRIEIRYDKNEPPTSATGDDTNIAVYLNNNNLYLQDTLLVNNVSAIGTNPIFSKNGNEITIRYRVLDTYPNDGYQAQDIVTKAIMRN